MCDKHPSLLEGCFLFVISTEMILRNIKIFMEVMGMDDSPGADPVNSYNSFELNKIAISHHVGSGL